MATKKPQTKPAGKRTGRPTKFDAALTKKVEKFCRLGATDVEIADFLEVDVRTVQRWRAQHEDFCRAIKAGKEFADERVERSLFARATGYEHDEVDIRAVQGEIVQTPIRKYYPPDTTACIFWLKNRRPEDWREKIEHTGPNGSPLLTALTVTYVKAQAPSDGNRAPGVG